jgi:hypothetical protein
MIKIGIMSFAHLHAEAYIQNIRSIPGLEWIGFVDPDNDRVKQFSEQFRTWGTSDFDEFFAKKPDGVVICSENNNHLSMVETAIAAGVKNICAKSRLPPPWKMRKDCFIGGIKKNQPDDRISDALFRSDRRGKRSVGSRGIRKDLLFSFGK